MTEHLYTTADVKRVREFLIKEQDGLDKATSLPIPDKQAVLDHCHKTQRVRGVLHRQTNAYLGKLENNYTRLIGYWYPGTLPEFLLEISKYLKGEHDERFIHSGWLKKANTEFNKLTESQKQSLLLELKLSGGANGRERKESFRIGLLSREFGYDDVLQAILITKLKETNAI